MLPGNEVRWHKRQQHEDRWAPQHHKNLLWALLCSLSPPEWHRPFIHPFKAKCAHSHTHTHFESSMYNCGVGTIPQVPVIEKVWLTDVPYSQKMNSMSKYFDTDICTERVNCGYYPISYFFLLKFLDVFSLQKRSPRSANELQVYHVRTSILGEDKLRHHRWLWIEEKKRYNSLLPNQ